MAPGREGVVVASKHHWFVPAGLIALSLVPVAAGSARLAQLAGGAVATADNARFVTSPLPVVLHIVSATVFCLLGALQFAPTLRRRAWHRRAGRVVVPAGIVAAASGLWMAVRYDLPASDNEVLMAMRLVVGTGMLAALVLAVAAVRRRDFVRHRNWMMRGYAIGIGAGTQVLTTLPWVLAFGQPSPMVRAGLMGAGWAINLAVAEWFIRRRPAAVPGQRPGATAGTPGAAIPTLTP
jgi:uncharacterized membrane protein